MFPHLGPASSGRTILPARAMAAQEMIAAGELIEKPKRFKTLYYGLKLNHPRNVALIHPLIFTLRRIIYAFSVVSKFGMMAMMTRLMMESIFMMDKSHLVQRTENSQSRDSGPMN